MWHRGNFEIYGASALLAQVEKGENIIITKHNHPIAKSSPIRSLGRAQFKLTMERLKAFGRKHTLGKIDWKVLRDEGRR